MSTDLDDILNRSLRLKTPMNFRIPHEFPNTLQHSQKFLENFKGENNSKARELGLQLLAKQKVNDRAVDISHTYKIFVKSISEKPIVLRLKLSFSDKCAEALKTSISESVEKSSKKDELSLDDYIFSNLFAQMKNKETEIHRCLCQYEPASISRFDNPQTKDDKMYLKSLSSFYYAYLFETDFIHSIEGTIRSEAAQEYYSRDVQTALANTYSIIDCITKEKSPILGSIRYLTNLSRRVIKDEVNKNPINAKRGGQIGLIPTIKAYVKLQRNEFKDSPWAILYFAIRCGVRDELFQYIDENNIFSDNIKSALEMYFQHLPLTKSVADDLEKYHSRDVTMSKVDPYKTIILSILTKKHILPDSADTIKSLEEWLWIRMQYINGDNSNGETNDGLRQLQEELKDFHPVDRSNPFLCGQFYLLINQYQKAAEWFLRCEDNADDCLHIVISMSIANLIDDQCLVQPLLLYAKDVFLSNPLAAIRYLSLIHDKDSKVDTIARLVVEVENGEKIFTPLLNELPPISMVLTPDLQRKVIMKSAQLSEYRGLHLKAAKIYKKLGNHDHVADLSCIELRKYISGFLDDSVRVELHIMYDSFLTNNSPVSSERIKVMNILLHFADAFHSVQQGELRKAVDQIEMANFLPTSKEQALSFRQTLMANEELRKALPELIILAIRSYARLYEINSASNLKKPGMWRKDREKADAILELTSDIDIPNYAQKQLLDLSLKFQ